MIQKQFSEIRKERAKQLLQKSQPEVLDENTYLMPSQNSDKKYCVTHFDAYTCDCEDFKRRCAGKGLYCKHIQAIILNEKIKHAVEIQEKNIIYQLEAPDKECCPFCSSEKIIKRGVRKNKLRLVQRYSCKECKKRFSLEPIKHLKVNAKYITLCMDCYFKGLSLRDIKDMFMQFYGIRVHHETIRRWILKFSQVLNEYSKTLQPKTSGVWNADETLILTKRGKNKLNTNYDYVWNVIDNKSKFLLASKCSGRSRSKKDAQKVLTEAYKQNVKMPNQVITDKLKAYQDGVRKTFRNWGNERKVKHTSILGKRRIVNNNAVESHHTQQKEFYKIRRGVKEVQNYQDGFRVFHNHIRKNVKDNKTPAEKCGWTITNQNRWLGMLKQNVQKIKQEVPIATQELKNVISPAG